MTNHIPKYATRSDAKVSGHDVRILGHKWDVKLEAYVYYVLWRGVCFEVPGCFIDEGRKDD